MYDGKVAVHWDKWQSKWRLYEGIAFRLEEIILMKNVYFFVQPEGRNKCREFIKMGQSQFDARFPHAFAFGELTETVPGNGWVEINYNPFRNNHFVFTHNNKSIIEAQFVRLLPSGKGEVISKESKPNFVDFVPFL